MDASETCNQLLGPHGSTSRRSGGRIDHLKLRGITTNDENIFERVAYAKGNLVRIMKQNQFTSHFCLDQVSEENASLAE
jgi:hypothetical protein